MKDPPFISNSTMGWSINDVTDLGGGGINQGIFDGSTEVL